MVLTPSERSPTLDRGNDIKLGVTVTSWRHSASQGSGMLGLTRRFGLLSLAVAFAALALRAPAQDDRWRSVNDRGNRYEGRVEIPVSSPELEIVSLAGFREPYDEDAVLFVKFFLAEPAPVTLQGLELQIDTQYLMEAKAGDWKVGEWNIFGPWPTRDVLDREGIPFTNLGVLITQEAESLRRYLPTFVYHSDPPRRAERYVLHLRPRVRLRKLSYTLTQLGDPEVELKAGRRLEDMEAGAPVRLELDAGEAKEGWLRVDVEGSYKSEPGGPKLSFELYHRPEIDG